MNTKTKLLGAFLAVLLVATALPAQDASMRSGSTEGIVGKDGTPMALVSAGEFWMGSPEGDRVPRKYLRHKVYLDAYYIDKYEVTVAQYRKYCEAAGRQMPAAPAWAWQDDNPIVNVSWEDANAYARYYGKRLPTEAEWEKAARSGFETKYSFWEAEKDLAGYPWHGEDFRRGSTHPVGTKRPNDRGMYDTYGNVWEWCADWYDADYYRKSPRKNPAGPAGGTYRILRGGRDVEPFYCRSAGRAWCFPTAGLDFIGFRCAASPPAAPRLP